MDFIEMIEQSTEDIEALTARLKSGELTMDAYLEELTPVLEGLLATVAIDAEEQRRAHKDTSDLVS